MTQKYKSLPSEKCKLKLFHSVPFMSFPCLAWDHVISSDLYKFSSLPCSSVLFRLSNSFSETILFFHTWLFLQTSSSFSCRPTFNFKRFLCIWASDVPCLKHFQIKNLKNAVAGTQRLPLQSPPSPAAGLAASAQGQARTPGPAPGSPGHGRPRSHEQLWNRSPEPPGWAGFLQLLPWGRLLLQHPSQECLPSQLAAGWLKWDNPFAKAWEPQNLQEIWQVAEESRGSCLRQWPIRTQAKPVSAPRLTRTAVSPFKPNHHVRHVNISSVLCQKPRVTIQEKRTLSHVPIH